MLYHFSDANTYVVITLVTNSVKLPVVTSWVPKDFQRLLVNLIQVPVTSGYWSKNRWSSSLQQKDGVLLYWLF